MPGSNLHAQSEAMFGHTRHVLVYGEWITQRPLKSYFEKVKDLVGSTKIVYVSELMELTGLSDQTIVKSLFHLGYLMLATGEAMVDSSWEFAPEHKPRVFIKPARTSTRRRGIWTPPPVDAATEPVTVAENVTPVEVQPEPEEAIVRFHPRQIRGVWGVLDTERNRFLEVDGDTDGSLTRYDTEFFNGHPERVDDWSGGAWVDPATVGVQLDEAEPVGVTTEQQQDAIDSLAEMPVDTAERGEPMDLTDLPADTTIGQLLNAAAVLGKTVVARLVPFQRNV